MLSGGRRRKGSPNHPRSLAPQGRDRSRAAAQANPRSGPLCSSSCVPRVPPSCSFLLQVNAGQPALLEAGLGFHQNHMSVLSQSPGRCSQSKLGLPLSQAGTENLVDCSSCDKGMDDQKECSPHARRLPRDLIPWPYREVSSVAHLLYRVKLEARRVGVSCSRSKRKSHNSRPGLLSS